VDKRFLALRTMFLALRTRFLALRTRFLALRTRFLALRTRFLALRTMLLALRTRFLVTCVSISILQIEADTNLNPNAFHSQQSLYLESNQNVAGEI
jgi:hypothetical protein